MMKFISRIIHTFAVEIPSIYSTVFEWMSRQLIQPFALPWVDWRKLSYTIFKKQKLKHNKYKLLQQYMLLAPWNKLIIQKEKWKQICMSYIYDFNSKWKGGEELSR